MVSRASAVRCVAGLHELELLVLQLSLAGLLSLEFGAVAVLAMFSPTITCSRMAETGAAFLGFDADQGLRASASVRVRRSPSVSVNGRVSNVGRWSGVRPAQLR